jgi:tetratricopeptide (TPR) repeat protein
VNVAHSLPKQKTRREGNPSPLAFSALSSRSRLADWYEFANKFHRGGYLFLEEFAVKISTTLVLVVIILATDVRPVAACLWDYDTLAMERQRFPNALELITGKFLRHSPEFYQWRVDDRLKRLEGTPDDLALYDDLAVAYEKLGHHDEAIKTILKKDKIAPGLYETHANLGTFYIHAGRLEEGIEQIDLAIKINPDAHFGREKYQKLLVQYVLSKRIDGKLTLPLGDGRSGGFVQFILDSELIGASQEAKAIGLRDATTGVLGMMRFGNHDSPILLEALGDLLKGGDRRMRIDAARMAARAFLKASYESQDKTTRKAYRQIARECLEMQTIDPSTTDRLKLEALESNFAEELAEAEIWYGEVHADEIAWIAEGKNAEAEFDLKYYKQPEAEDRSEYFDVFPRTWRLIGAIVVGLLMIVISIAIAIVWLRRRRTSPT